MQKELDLEISGSVAADTSNLMRLIQGTVMPQVHTHASAVCFTRNTGTLFYSYSWHIKCIPFESDTSHLTSSIYIIFPSLKVNAGAGEVARVFLSPAWRQSASPQAAPVLSVSPVTTSSSSSSPLSSTRPYSVSSTRAMSPLSQNPSLSRNMSVSSSVPSNSVSSLNLKEDTIEPNPETAEEAIDREAKSEIRMMADKKALIAMGETLQLKLRVWQSSHALSLSILFFHLSSNANKIHDITHLLPYFFSNLFSNFYHHRKH
jgi:hypothetical protein